jgi:PIN like domain
MTGRPEATYFTDRDLGHQFPQVLRATGLKVERHDDHFSPLTQDDEWLPIIGRKGWIAVTRDARIRYSPLALRVSMESGVRLFVMVGKLTASESPEIFLKWRKQIEAFAEAESAAFIAKVRRDGVHLWIRYADWSKSRR